MKNKRFFTKKKLIWAVVLILVVVGVWALFFNKSNKSTGILTALVSKQDLKETVLTTGQVVSGIDLNLSFQGSGVVKRLYVKEGDKVGSGQLLAALDTSVAQANLSSAQGTLLQAKASYQKLLAGASAEDIKVYEDAVDSAQIDLDSSLGNVPNTLNDAYTKIYNSLATTTTIKDKYFIILDQAGYEVQNNLSTMNKSLDTARASLGESNAETGISKMSTALNNVLNALKAVRNVCDQGNYYATVSSTDKALLDTQIGYINTGLTSITTAKDGILSYKIALQKAQSQLALKKAPVRQADIDVALAQVASAQGQVDAAQASLNNLTLIAPDSGTITLVDTKVGEQVSPGLVIIELQNISDLHAEANVSEANIASLQLGQSVDYTFDALGPDEHFAGKILTINPASTVVSGVVNYKVTGSLENVPRIKPGMTANMTVLVAEKQGVLAVPSTAVMNKNGGQYVKIMDDKKTSKYHEVQVQTGLQADGGMVEILSGLSEGQEIITYMK